MEVLRKIVPGSALEPLFSLPHSSRDVQYEVIVLPFLAGNEYRRDDTGQESLAGFLRGSLGDFEFDCFRELTAERGTPVEILN